MDKAEVRVRNCWVETDLEDFERRVKGISREKYPELRCIACERPVHDSGLVTPNAEYSPRFTHSTPPPIGEFCPLSSKCGRRLRLFPYKKVLIEPRPLSNRSNMKKF